MDILLSILNDLRVCHETKGLIEPISSITSEPQDAQMDLPQRVNNVHSVKLLQPHQTNLTCRQISLRREVLLSSPRSHVWPLLDHLIILATPHPLYKLLWMKIRTHGILPKLLRLHKLNRLLNRIKIINLSLNHVPIRINIIHARRRPMVHRPNRSNAHLLLLLIGIGQLTQRLIPKRSMAQPHDRTSVLRSWDSILPWRDTDTVVLLVVRNECDEFGGVGSETACEVNVPFYHFLVVFRFRSKDEVAEVRGFDGSCGGLEADEGFVGLVA